jgi:hypothetical protein
MWCHAVWYSEDGDSRFLQNTCISTIPQGITSEKTVFFENTLDASIKRPLEVT